VITRPLDATKSFAVFAGKLFNTTNVDFSGSATAAIKRHLRRAEMQRPVFATPSSSSSSSSNGSSKGEAPLARYARLKQELSEFQQDLHAMAAQAKQSAAATQPADTNGSSSNTTNAVAAVSQFMIDDLHSMDARLSAMLSDASVRPFLQRQMHTDVSMQLAKGGDVMRALLTHLGGGSEQQQLQQSTAAAAVTSPTQRRKASESKKRPAVASRRPSSIVKSSHKTDAAAAGEPAAALTYELFVKNNSGQSTAAAAAAASCNNSNSNSSKNKAQQAAAAAASNRMQFSLVELDRRLGSLETLVGPDEGGDTKLNIPFDDIQTGLTTLHRKLELLDQHKLDGIYRRIKTLSAELDMIEQQQQAVMTESQQQKGGKGSVYMEKIASLYSIMHRWDTTAQQLPLVVSRLQSLKDLHEESADAAVRLQHVARTQDKCRLLLQSDRTALRKLQESVAANAKIMHTNVTALESRFTALAAKMDKLR
jgi:hypothetical protein